jgi:predicted kinase
MYIVFTCGISGSGKTTWTENFIKLNNSYVNINRDDIRSQLFFDGEVDFSRYKHSRANEKLVTEKQEELILKAVKNNKNIIISDTNLNIKYIDRVVNLLNDLDIEFKYDTRYFNIDLIEAINRDNKREKSVGYNIICSQYKRFCEIYYKYHIHSDIKRNAFICDIDGTIATNKGVRNIYDYNNVDKDLPRNEIILMVDGLIESGLFPIFCSGRSAICMDKTGEWINKNFPQLNSGFALLMREEGDKRKDTIVKKEIFNKYIDNNFNIKVVLDDRKSVTRMWRYELGLQVIDVGEPNIEF